MYTIRFESDQSLRSQGTMQPPPPSDSGGPNPSLPARLKARVEAHLGWTVLTGLGAAASIVGLILLGLPSIPWAWGVSHSDASVEVFEITVVDRGPLWGHEYFDDDEVIAAIEGRVQGFDSEKNAALVAFWRLPSDYETNWHVGKRTVGGNYELATLGLDMASNRNWTFLVGGIKVDRGFEGSVAVVVCLMAGETVEAERESWLDDENGWGFREVPSGGRLVVTSPILFTTTPVR